MCVCHVNKRDGVDFLLSGSRAGQQARSSRISGREGAHRENVSPPSRFCFVCSWCCEMSRDVRLWCTGTCRPFRTERSAVTPSPVRRRTTSVRSLFSLRCVYRVCVLCVSDRGRVSQTSRYSGWSSTREPGGAEDEGGVWLEEQHHVINCIFSLFL